MKKKEKEIPKGKFQIPGGGLTKRAIAFEGYLNHRGKGGQHRGTQREEHSGLADFPTSGLL
jgi:hypothetical protein